MLDLCSDIFVVAGGNKAMLHIASVEFATELFDFTAEDVDSVLGSFYMQD